MDYDELVTAAKDGEAWAGPALVTVLLPMSMQYARSIGSDLGSADQEAVVETAILRAVERIDRFDSERATFPSWVRGFVRHAVADHRRAAGPEFVDLPPDLPEREVEPTPAGDDLPGAVEQAVTLALLRLSLTDQVIITLRDFENLPYKECAERIGGGVTEGSCRVRHLRATRRLQAILESEGIQDQTLTGSAGT